MFDVFKNRLELTGTLTAVTALRVSEGRSVDVNGSDLPVMKDALGQPLIPGSSFKGALRSRLESFLRAIDLSLAVSPDVLVSREISQEVTRLKQQYENDAELTVQLKNITDAASLVFGSPWQASKFQVRDLTVVNTTWFDQYQERNGVSIDRDTETAADGRLYDFQVVPAGVKFHFRAVVENAEDWELGLISIGMHQFETEQIPIGGAVSRGLGVVKLEDLTWKWFNACDKGKTQPNPEKVKNYLRNMLSNQDPSYEEIAHCREHWGDELIKKLPELMKEDTHILARTSA
ncbi:MAG: CRISPR-associated RAMP protein Csx7 [Cyanobacteria bacterium J06614_10]